MTKEEREKANYIIADILIELGYAQLLIDGIDLDSLIELIRVHSLDNSVEPIKL